MCIFTVLPSAGWCYPNEKYRAAQQSASRPVKRLKKKRVDR
jgi:hypothetical protein